MLERMARAEKLPYQEVLRARIVLYAARGVPDTEIARRLDTSTSLVGRWRRRFAADRLEGLTDKPRSGRPRRFPPEQVAEVKAIACELPSEHGRPLGRFSRTELHRLVIERGVSEASASTIWRILARGCAQAPGSTAAGICPRDPDFARKAGRDLDWQRRVCAGAPLPPAEYVICADEQTQPQARGRRHPTTPAGPVTRRGSSTRTARRGAGLPRRLGRPPRRARRALAPNTGRARRPPVDQVMTREPYSSAPRVCWIVDNGSSHAGRRPPGACGNATPTPPGPPADPRLLAQPDRDFLLDRPAQGAHAQRLPVAQRARCAAAGLRRALPAHRPAVRVDLHLP